MICCILSLIIFAALAYKFFTLDANPLLAFYERFFPNKDKLRNKTVWIVGASTGIGEALAHKFAELNCRLVLTSTSEAKLEKVKAECLKRSQNSLKSDDILVLPYNIADFAKNDDAFRKIVDKMGNIDILIPNAARMTISHVQDDDFELHRDIMNVNYFANIYISKLVVRHWLAIKSEGIICPTSSVGSYGDLPYLSPYTVTKKAMNNFYRDLAAQTFKDNIRVCLAVPGPVETEIGENSIGGPENKIQLEGQEKKMPAARCAELMVIAMANKLNESWISIQPWLFVTYLNLYFGFELHWMMKNLGLVRFMENYYVKKNN